MDGLFGVIMVGGAFATSIYYWFTYGRYEDYVLGRVKTSFAFFFWYAFLVYLCFLRSGEKARQDDADEARRRILG